jgi:hypothetical protein
VAHEAFEGTTLFLQAYSLSLEGFSLGNLNLCLFLRKFTLYHWDTNFRIVVEERFLKSSQKWEKFDKRFDSR